jgi:hypothetical protein
VTVVAIGLELSADVDMAAIAVAGSEGGTWRADLMFYGSPDDAVAEASRLYGALEDNCGVFCDPMPCAGILDALAAAVQLTRLGPEDVAAAAWQFTTEVRARRVKLAGHPALKESMRAAVPRPLAARFAFERRRVSSDMSPLNAAAFALLGLRRNTADGDPGVWVIDGLTDEDRLMERLRRQTASAQPDVAAQAAMPLDPAAAWPPRIDW